MLQVVAGINHILHLETSDDAGRKEVEVTVYEKLPANVKANESPLELTNSKLVGPVAEVSRGAGRPAMGMTHSPKLPCMHVLCLPVLVDDHAAPAALTLACTCFLSVCVRGLTLRPLPLPPFNCLPRCSSATTAGRGQDSRQCHS